LRGLSRRTVLVASVVGGAAVITLPLVTLLGGQAEQQPGSSAPGVGSGLLNDGWLFGGEYQPGTEAADFDDSDFAAVTVPHSVAALSWCDWDPVAWQRQWIYRRHFDGSGIRHGYRVFVDFDGVMTGATVLCNNVAVGQHQGGYLPFSAELTSALTRRDNLLSVIVDSRCLPVPPIVPGAGPDSIDFMQPGGIYRDVRMRVEPPVFISDLFALPQDVLTAHPSVSVTCTIDAGPHGWGSAATLLVELLDGTERIAGQTIPVPAGRESVSTVLGNLPPVRLWSVDSPVLYTVRATLDVPSIGTSVLTRRIGFREATFQPDGFYLNGQRLQLFGLDRHQLFPYTGMAMPARVQQRDAEILRNELNCNMVRCSHYPQSPAFLDACDELGLLVWEEAPGWAHVSDSAAWQDLVISDVRDMVTRDRSRPSVIIWGTRLNEARGAHPALWAATRQAAHELDPSRPSSGAMDRHTVDGWAEDVFAYNDYTVAADGTASLHPPLPGLPYLVTEAVGVKETLPRHFSWTDPPAVLANQAALHAQAQSKAHTAAGYAGLLGWAAFDYSSPYGHPAAVKWAGVADGFRAPKPGAAIYQSQLDPRIRPLIIPAFWWEPGGAQPSGEPLLIASNCEQLQIFVGGKHLATAAATGNPLYRDLPYPPFLVSLPAVTAPSDLHIEGYVGGQQVTSRTMSGDLTLDRLGMQADDDAITADGSDMTRVLFRAVDAYGNQRRYFADDVTLNLTGPGALVGDNPFPFGEYGGLGAVWVRSFANQPGSITVSAAHNILGDATVQIQSRPASAAHAV
jgi:beta-galactosidase